ncbi:MAG: hypothetical protein QNJ63_09975 [Calothrix sp. MO_192.B10]|nr:hypothetical protein [Calothrix sp. MO_192.B10]
MKALIRAIDELIGELEITHPCFLLKLEITGAIALIKNIDKGISEALGIWKTLHYFR